LLSMDRPQARSQALYRRAARSVPAGVHSNTRFRAPWPLYFTRAEGPYAWDADGNRYIDLMLGNGAIALGHAHPEVQAAVRAQLETGLTTGLESPLAAEAAERLLAMVPQAERVRFATTGTEAVMHALMLARAYTGRSRVAKIEGAYHGWYDPVYVSAWPDLGRAGSARAPLPVPGAAGLDREWTARTVVIPQNDLAAAEAILAAHAGELAALLVEPVLIDTGFIPCEPAYLRGLRAACDRLGIVLIFDELLTGFRLAPGGAQEAFGVRADLVTYGKAIANGFVLSAVAGKAEIMALSEPGAGRPGFVGTFNGHSTSLAAAIASLEVLGRGAQAAFAEGTRQLQAAFSESARRHGVEATLVGGGGHFQWYFAPGPFRCYRDAARTDAGACARFVAALLQRGIYALPGPTAHHAISLAHTGPVLEQVAAAFDAGLRAVAEGRP
jgi:glutamate-1-semialdehyde 2,1-aminomutase